MITAVVAVLLGAEPALVPEKTTWSAACEIDELTDARTCWVRADEIERPFHVMWSGDEPPIILAGIHDFPGRTATVRVDKGKPREFGYAARDIKSAQKQTAALLPELKKGQAVMFEWHRWPTGAERGALLLEGFPEAYENALRLKKAGGVGSWPPPAPPPPPTVLEVRGLTPEMMVRIDDRFVNRKTGRINLEPGTHELVVRRIGLPDIKLTVTLKEGVVSYVDLATVVAPEP